MAFTNTAQIKKKNEKACCSPPECLWVREVRLRPERRSGLPQHPHRLNNNLPIKPKTVYSKLPARAEARIKTTFLTRWTCLVFSLWLIFISPTSGCWISLFLIIFAKKTFKTLQLFQHLCGQISQAKWGFKQKKLQWLALTLILQSQNLILFWRDAAVAGKRH